VASLADRLPFRTADGSVGWEPRADPKIIEKIDEFARDLAAFVAGFVLISISKQLFA
jgi:hypothetical protein